MSAKRRKLPKTASVAVPGTNGKLHAPSATRNIEAILKAMRAFIPATGTALEIASGTGEHIVRHAAAYPNMVWQPTDIAPDRLDSIAAWVKDVDLPNILAPKQLDATSTGWASQWIGQDLIVVSNLLHLISEDEARTIISQSAQALNPGGVFLIYGPFLRGANFASDADRSFNDSLRDQDAEIGYKSFQSIQSAQIDAGLTLLDSTDMPSNNLLLAAQK